MYICDNGLKKGLKIKRKKIKRKKAMWYCLQGEGCKVENQSALDYKSDRNVIE